MNIHHKSKILQTLTVLILISVTIMGGDCQKVLLNTNTVPQELIGNWKLAEQTGALQDICPDEEIKFQSSGVALLTCPGSNAISRNFKVENNVLSYTETSIDYDLAFENNDQQITLTGQNISRNLKYLKIATSDTPVSVNENKDMNNSSEKKETGK